MFATPGIPFRSIRTVPHAPKPAFSHFFDQRWASVEIVHENVVAESLKSFKEFQYYTVWPYVFVLETGNFLSLPTY